MDIDLQRKELLDILLRWYYGYHRAIDAHKIDAGDFDIKPHFLSVYKETNEILSKLRQFGIVMDEQCHKMYEKDITKPKFIDIDPTRDKIESEILKWEKRRVEAVRLHNSCSNEQPEMRDMLWKWMKVYESFIDDLKLCLSAHYSKKAINELVTELGNDHH